MAVLIGPALLNHPGTHEKQVGVDQFFKPVIRNVTNPIRYEALLFGNGLQAVAKKLGLKVPADVLAIRVSGRKRKQAVRLGCGQATIQQVNNALASLESKLVR